MGGVVVDVRAAVGDGVLAGDALMVISAMKMEAVVTAPCAGTIARVLPLQPGDCRDAGPGRGRHRAG